MNNFKKIIAMVLSFILLVSTISDVSVLAARQPKLNKKTATIYVGSTLQLKLKNNKKNVTWSSSNKKIATVTKKGKVTGKKAGNVTITAKAGGKKYKCKVIISAKAKADVPVVVAPTTTETTKNPETTVAPTTKTEEVVTPNETTSNTVETTTKPNETVSTETYVDEVIPPTCTTDGKIIRRYSDGRVETLKGADKVGDIIYTDENGELVGHYEHPYVENPVWHTEVEASCNHVGKKYRICERCGEKCFEEIPKIQHTWKDYKKDATCEEVGEEYMYCTVCGEKRNYKTIEAKGHNYVPTKKDATCTEAGYNRTKCTRCGKIIKDETIKALGHKYVSTRIVNPSCTESGEQADICSRCGKVINKEEIPAIGHDWKVFSTCDENFLKNFPFDYNPEMSSDNYGKYELIYMYTRYPTHDEFGQKYRECKKCGYKEYSKVAKLTTPSKYYTISLGGGKTAQVFGYYDREVADLLFEKTNDYRTGNVLAKRIALNKPKAELQKCSDIRAAEASYSYSHTRPNGSSYGSVSEGTGTPILAENLDATGNILNTANKNAEMLLSDFKNSYKHNDILLMTGVKSVGISVFVSEDLGSIPSCMYPIRYAYTTIMDFSSNSGIVEN